MSNRRRPFFKVFRPSPTRAQQLKSNDFSIPRTVLFRSISLASFYPYNMQHRESVPLRSLAEYHAATSELLRTRCSVIVFSA